jgi:hydroxymethylpyrimidine pyrophosphatase-like HAD family hydrolase
MDFVFDLDGTICFRGQPLSYNMVAELDMLIEKRHSITFASARPIREGMRAIWLWLNWISW